MYRTNHLLNVLSARNYRTNFLAEKVGSKLSTDGMSWITAALDPFHDDPLYVRGTPDGCGRNTILQRVEQSITINAPAGVAGNWDCHVFNLPVLTTTTAASIAGIATDGTYMFAKENVGTTANIPIAPVVIATGPSGSALLPFGAGAFAPANVEYNYVTPNVGPGDFPQQRFVAGGFEVTNTTAEIYRQGLCTSYRQPVDFSRGRMQFQVGAGPIRFNDSSIIAPCPPVSVAECLYLPGTTQWPAAEGGYSVITFAPEEEKFSQSTGSPIFFKRQVTTVTTCVGFGLFENVDPTATQETFFTKPSHQNMSGQYYTGLSNQTTLQVNVVYYLEYAPSAAESSYAIIAKPSPTYDSNAFTLYSEAVSHMPVCYPVAMNARGDVWRKIVGTLASFADFLPNNSNPDSLMGKVALKLREAHLNIANDQLIRNKNPIKKKQRNKESDEQYKSRIDKLLSDQNARIARSQAYVDAISRKLAVAPSAGVNAHEAHQTTPKKGKGSKFP